MRPLDEFRRRPQWKDFLCLCRVEWHPLAMRWVIVLTICQVLTAASFDLDALRWQNRVILVFAPNLDTEAMRQQRNHLSEDSCGLAERHLRVATVGSVSGKTLDGQALAGTDVDRLRRRFGVAPDGFTVLLIGKDGGVKLRKSQPVQRHEFYLLIDRMPMRIQEARTAAKRGVAACKE